MANMSTWLEERVLNHVFRNTTYTAAATVFVGLVSDIAADADLEAGLLVNEITAYTGDRKAVVFSAPAQSGGVGQIQNTTALDFENMPTVTVKYAIVCDNATKGAGNILYWCPLTLMRSVNVGDILRLPVNGLTLTIA